MLHSLNALHKRIFVVAIVAIVGITLLFGTTQPASALNNQERQFLEDACPLNLCLPPQVAGLTSQWQAAATLTNKVKAAVSSTLKSYSSLQKVVNRLAPGLSSIGTILDLNTLKNLPNIIKNQTIANFNKTANKFMGKFDGVASLIKDFPKSLANEYKTTARGQVNSFLKSVERYQSKVLNLDFDKNLQSVVGYAQDPKSLYGPTLNEYKKMVLHIKNTQDFADRVEAAARKNADRDLGFANGKIDGIAASAVDVFDPYKNTIVKTLDLGKDKNTLKKISQAAGKIVIADINMTSAQATNRFNDFATTFAPNGKHVINVNKLGQNLYNVIKNRPAVDTYLKNNNTPKEAVLKVGDKLTGLAYCTPDSPKDKNGTCVPPVQPSTLIPQLTKIQNNSQVFIDTLTERLDTLPDETVNNVTQTITNYSNVSATIDSLNSMTGDMTAKVKALSLSGIANNLNSFTDQEIEDLAEQMKELKAMPEQIAKANVNYLEKALTNFANYSVAEANAILADPTSIIAINNAMGYLNNTMTSIQGIGTNAAHLGTNLPNAAGGMVTTAISDTTSSIAGSIIALKDNHWKDMVLKSLMPKLNASNVPTPPVFSAPADGIQGALPNQEMRSKNTPALSLIQNFPWSWKNVDVAIQKAAYREVGNSAYIANDSPVSADPNINNSFDAPDVSSAATNPNGDSAVAETDRTKCGSIVDMCNPNNGPDYAHYERWVRMKYDSCANEYILSDSTNPSYIFAGNNKDKNGNFSREHFSFDENVCQPLRLSTVDCIHDWFDPDKKCKIDKGSADGVLYDYRAWAYLARSYQDLLDLRTSPGVDTFDGYMPNIGGNPNPDPYTPDVVTPVQRVVGDALATAGAAYKPRIQPSGKNNGGNSLLFGSHQNPDMDQHIALMHGEYVNNKQLTPLKYTMNGHVFNVSAGLGFAPTNSGTATPEFSIDDKGFYYSATQPDYVGKLITVNDLPKVALMGVIMPGAWEKINDPVHAFSPRYDIAVVKTATINGATVKTGATDRLYSKLAALKPSDILAIPGLSNDPVLPADFNQQGVVKYPDITNITASLGYDEVGLSNSFGLNLPVLSGECIVRCASVPVDILSFRAPQFDKCMNCRIKNNEDCFWSQVAWYMTPWVACLRYTDVHLIIPLAFFTIDIPIWHGCITRYVFDGYNGNITQAIADTINDQTVSDSHCHLEGRGSIIGGWAFFGWSDISNPLLLLPVLPPLTAVNGDYMIPPVGGPVFGDLYKPIYKWVLGFAYQLQAAIMGRSNEVVYDCMHIIHYASADMANLGLMPFDQSNNATLSCKYSHARQNNWPICSTKVDFPHDKQKTDYTLGVYPYWTNTNDSDSSYGGPCAGTSKYCNSPYPTARALPIPNNVPYASAVGFKNKVVNCADCTHQSGDPNDNAGVKKCCGDLAMALVPLNTLKIRSKDEAFPDGNVPEGYSFREYFGDHMPYMRHWDDGTATGGTLDPTYFNFNPLCNQGADDVIVGVGREESSCRYGGNGFTPDDTGDSANNVPIDPTSVKRYKATDAIPNIFNPYTKKKYAAGDPVPVRYNQCLTWHINPLTNKATDALTSWTELKMYQMRSNRMFGLNCIPQYEKVYKQFGTEDGALYNAGGYFTTRIPSSFDKTTGKFSKSFHAKDKAYPLRWRGYLSDPDNGGMDSTYKLDGAGNVQYDVDKQPIINNDVNCSVANSNDGSRFPCMQSDPKNDVDKNNNPRKYIFTGLDNVKVGDIIYLTHDDVSAKPPQPAGAGGKMTNGLSAIPIMPFTAVVTEVHMKNTAPTCQDYIVVRDINNGKFPDACGVTDHMGHGQPRRIYRDFVSPDAGILLFQGSSFSNSCGEGYSVTGTSSININNFGSCLDPLAQNCSMKISNFNYAPTGTRTQKNIWDIIHVYRGTLDVRDQVPPPVSR